MSTNENQTKDHLYTLGEYYDVGIDGGKNPETTFSEMASFFCYFILRHSFPVSDASLELVIILLSQFPQS